MNRRENNFSFLPIPRSGNSPDIPWGSMSKGYGWALVVSASIMGSMAVYRSEEWMFWVGATLLFAGLMQLIGTRWALAVWMFLDAGASLGPEHIWTSVAAFVGGVIILALPKRRVDALLSRIRLP